MVRQTAEHVSIKSYPPDWAHPSQADLHDSKIDEISTLIDEAYMNPLSVTNSEEPPMRGFKMV